MSREDYIALLNANMIGKIALLYFKDKGLKTDENKFISNLNLINFHLNQNYNFDISDIINELNIKFNVIIVEDLESKKVYKII